tara:strand:- start:167 stop:1078 length:912 start_codon:yes stop_codon:yes gene_type:complete
MKISRLFWVGFIVFSSILVFYYGIRFLQEESFQSTTFKFSVVFNDLQGLDISDDVKMLGKKIGRITGTRIIGEKIATELTLDNTFAFKIPIDSKFEISQSDLMGSKFISIYPGKDNDKFILEGETIAGENAEVVSLTKDIGDFAKRLNNTFGKEQEQQIQNTISNIEVSSESLEKFIEQNRDIITQEEKENLHSLLKNINSISIDLEYILNEESEDIKQSIQNFNSFMKKTPDISNQIDDITVSIKQIVDNINNGTGSMSKLLNQDSLYNNVNGLVLDARLLLDDVKNNPTKYLKAYFNAKKK